MILSHKIELDPTESQRSYFVKAAGCARFVWNWALAEWSRQLLVGNNPNCQELRKEFNSKFVVHNDKPTILCEAVTHDQSSKVSKGYQ